MAYLFTSSLLNPYSGFWFLGSLCFSDLTCTLASRFNALLTIVFAHFEIHSFFKPKTWGKLHIYKTMIFFRCAGPS